MWKSDNQEFKEATFFETDREEVVKSCTEVDRCGEMQRCGEWTSMERNGDVGWYGEA